MKKDEVYTLQTIYKKLSYNVIYQSNLITKNKNFRLKNLISYYGDPAVIY